jgi:phosphoribosylformylglycinamidine cyclo-ligase
MPGFYAPGVYDLAGFAVGVVEKDAIVSGDALTEGDALIGLASSGVHSNGFSLVRALVKELSAPFNGRSIGEELLTPTRIYVKPVLAVLQQFPGAVHAMAHITGGGFYENIPRMFAEANAARAARGLAPLLARVENGSWPVTPIFNELVRLGADSDALFNTFNMGIGFVLAVDAERAEEIRAALDAEAAAYRIGRVQTASGAEQSGLLLV